MLRKLAIVFLLVAASCSDDPRPATDKTAGAVECENAWSPVADGIHYRTLNCSADRFDLHLVRVDPSRADIDAVVQPGSMAAGAGKSAAFALNANFFDEHFKPLGVVMSGGKLLNPVHPVSWQSVFLITKDHKARIVRQEDWEKARASAVTAVQAGPRLVINGQRNDVAQARPVTRSGVCIDQSSQVVFFVTPPESQLDVWQIAEIALRPETAGGLGCRDAMLFDGGPSVQLFVNRPGRPIHVEGDKAVPVFVVGSARSK